MDISEDKCSICKDPLMLPGGWEPEADNYVLSTLCHHFFHQKCLKDWFHKGNDYCHICKKKSHWNEATSATIVQRNRMTNRAHGHDTALATGEQAQRTWQEGEYRMRRESESWWGSDGQPEARGPSDAMRKICKTCYKESEQWWKDEEDKKICKTCGEKEEKYNEQLRENWDNQMQQIRQEVEGVREMAEIKRMQESENWWSDHVESDRNGRSN